MKVPATGGTLSLLTKVDPSRGEVAHEAPWFLPDGRHFLYVRGPGPDAGTYVGSLDLGPEQQDAQRLLPAAARYAPALGAGPGYLLFIQNGTLMAQVFDASKMQLKGDAIPLVQQVNSNGVDVSSNGILAYTNLANQDQLTWYDRQGKVVGTLGEPGVVQLTAISPDGSRVAVGRNVAGGTDLWVYNVATGAPTRLTFDGKTNEDPVWSPNGSHIAFATGRGGALTVYEMAVNGIGQIEALDKEPANLRVPLDWSHDGRYLIEGVLVDAKSKFSAWVLPLSPGQAGRAQKSFPYLSGSFNYTAPALSPNGEWLAYASDETGRYEIYVQTFPKLGGKWSVSTSGATTPVWSHDGAELYFLGGDGRLMSADVKSGPDGRFEASTPKAMFQTHVDSPLWRFAVGKDGRFLFATPAGQSGAPITVVVNWTAGLNK
jgi:hypothetical protein